MLADARPQARKNRKRIRWNTLRICRAENDPDACRLFAAVEWHDSDRLLRRHDIQGRSLRRPPPKTILALRQRRQKHSHHKNEQYRLRGVRKARFASHGEHFTTAEST